MLTENDKRVLETIGKRLLITKGELSEIMKSGDYNGNGTSLQRLKDMGYVEAIESLGTCLVVTQKGIRALKEQNVNL